MIQKIDKLPYKQKKLTKISFAAWSIHSDILYFTPFSGETFILLLEGSIEIEANNSFTTNLSKRSNVFNGKPKGVFIPAGYNINIKSKELSEIAVCSSLQRPKTKSLKPFKTNSKKAIYQWRGKERYKRKVINILDETDKADFLLIGETISQKGMWSSYPPHKHDTFLKNQEHQLEEIYFYKIANHNSFGLQTIYSPRNKYEKCFRVKNNDVIHIPFGYHPVAAPPDSKFYYLWILSGENRKLLYNDSPHKGSKP